MISIIIPTRNREEQFFRCLDAINSQTISKGKYEILAVNDGSKYEYNKIDKYTKHINNFKYFEIEHAGPATARNYGVEQSKGDIITFIDDDCVADKNWLFRIEQYFDDKDYVNIIAVGGSVKPLDLNKRIISSYLTFINFLDGPIYNDGKITNMATANLSVRKEAFNLIGGFNEKFLNSEDQNLVWRLSQKGELDFEENIVVMHNHDITYSEFIKKYIGYGRGITLHCHTSKEQFTNDDIYNIYCSKKHHILTKIFKILNRSTRKIKLDSKYKQITAVQRIVFYYLSFTQEICLQIGGIVMNKMIEKGLYQDLGVANDR